MVRAPWCWKGEVRLGMGLSAPGWPQGTFEFYTQADEESAKNQRITQMDTTGVE